MENINTILAKNIALFRKQKSLTQEQLAEITGVSYQAVSKWENEKSLPDIAILPILADTFGCTIDALFSREAIVGSGSNEITWDDDDKIRGVLFKGRKLLNASNPDDKTIIENTPLTIDLKGEIKHLECQCDVVISGSVSGGVNSTGEVTIGGNLSGGVNTCEEVSIGFNLSGGVNTCADVTIGGSVSGGIRAEKNIHVNGNVSGNVECDGVIQVEGNIEAERIKGNVTCCELKCDRVEGNVSINK